MDAKIDRSKETVALVEQAAYALEDAAVDLELAATKGQGYVQVIAKRLVWLCETLEEVRRVMKGRAIPDAEAKHVLEADMPVVSFLCNELSLEAMYTRGKVTDDLRDLSTYIDAMRDAQKKFDQAMEQVLGHKPRGVYMI